MVPISRPEPPINEDAAGRETCLFFVYTCSHSLHAPHTILYPSIYTPAYVLQFASPFLSLSLSLCIVVLSLIAADNFFVTILLF